MSQSTDPEVEGIGRSPPNKLKAAFLLLRVQFTIASFIPFAIGTWWAQAEAGPLDAPIAILGLMAVFLCNLTANVLNDYFDRDTDRLVRPTPFSGGSGMIGIGALSPKFVLRFAIGLAATALLLAMVLQFYLGTGPWTIPFILLGLFISWAYSARPIRLVARGLGELTVALTVSFLVPLTAYYVQTGTATWSLIAICLTILPFIFLVMLSVHLPDYEGDVVASKTNLVVRLGMDPIKHLFFVVLVLPYLAIILLSLTGLLETMQFILFASLPLAILLVIKVRELRASDVRTSISVNAMTMLLAIVAGLLELSYVLMAN